MFFPFLKSVCGMVIGPSQFEFWEGHIDFMQHSTNWIKGIKSLNHQDSRNKLSLYLSVCILSTSGFRSALLHLSDSME